MIPALETAGFFLAITAALRFSTWAEEWLASTVKERAPDGMSSVRDLSDPASQHEAVRAA